MMWPHSPNFHFPHEYGFMVPSTFHFWSLLTTIIRSHIVAAPSCQPQWHLSSKVYSYGPSAHSQTMQLTVMKSGMYVKRRNVWASSPINCFSLVDQNHHHSFKQVEQRSLEQKIIQRTSASVNYSSRQWSLSSSFLVCAPFSAWPMQPQLISSPTTAWSASWTRSLTSSPWPCLMNLMIILAMLSLLLKLLTKHSNRVRMIDQGLSSGESCLRKDWAILENKEKTAKASRNFKYY